MCFSFLRVTGLEFSWPHKLTHPPVRLTTAQNRRKCSRGRIRFHAIVCTPLLVFVNYYRTRLIRFIVMWWPLFFVLFSQPVTRWKPTKVWQRSKYESKETSRYRVRTKRAIITQIGDVYDRMGLPFGRENHWTRLIFRDVFECKLFQKEDRFVLFFGSTQTSLRSRFVLEPKDW